MNVATYNKDLAEDENASIVKDLNKQLFGFLVIGLKEGKGAGSPQAVLGAC